MKSSGFLKEFKKFISRGNVIDMAIGISVGGAFTAIVNSFVNNLINPIIGLIVGGIDFSSLEIVLKPATETSEAVAIRYGLFINSIISFVIIAFTLFLVIKAFNKFKEKIRKEEKAAADATAAKPVTPPADIQLLTEIRDLLKERK